MGHVDHGKTSLLDYIRRTRVAAGEAGGITQHLGAYTVEHELNGEKRTLVFLDTPGHAAFSAMRARGANLTDIVVLVIAADDGMMPTTFEALNHARAAGVKIVVAINKCDLPRANVDRVKQQLQQHDLAPEDWGGTTSCVEISALKGTGVDSLLGNPPPRSRTARTQGDPKAPVRAIAIESRVEAGKGPTCTVIAQHRHTQSRDAVHLRPVVGQDQEPARTIAATRSEKPHRPSRAKSSASPARQTSAMKCSK